MSALYIVDNNLAPVLSESYGSCEAGGTGNFYGPLWEQAAAQGISAMVSTGDNGSAGCDDPNSEAYAVYGKNVNGIASTPWNAAIGGTDFNQPTQADLNTYWSATNAPITQESAKSYIPELTWNDSCANPLLQLLNGGSTSALTNCNNPNFSGFLDIVGGSGGASGSGFGAGFGWLKPAWQTGTGVPNEMPRPAGRFSVRQQRLLGKLLYHLPKRSNRGRLPSQHRQLSRIRRHVRCLARLRRHHGAGQPEVGTARSARPGSL